MADWLAGLGAGLETLGSQGMQYLAREQERKRQAELQKKLEQREIDEIKRAGLARDQQFQQFRFQNNLTPYQDAAEPIAQLDQTGQLMRGAGDVEMPFGMAGPMSAARGVGDALTALAQKSQKSLARGKTLDYTDAQGRTTKYYQPFEQSEEGKRERDLKAGIQALTKSGQFTLEEATAIMQSPEKLQGAIIDRLRPKTTPQRVVGPDGTVSFVTPPANMDPASTYTVPGVKANVSVPGQAPYGWSVQTDDTTGEMIQVDPRTGQTRPVMSPSGEPVRNLPDAVRQKAEALGDLRANLEQVQALVDQYGIELMPGEVKATMQAALSNAQVAWKEAAKLGALSGPDMGMVMNAIGDPTSFNGLAAGSGGIKAKLGIALKTLDGQEQRLTEQYGIRVPRRSGAALQLSPTEQAIYDAAKKENKSEAEIMAFITKMRGGGGL